MFMVRKISFEIHLIAYFFNVLNFLLNFVVSIANVFSCIWIRLLLCEIMWRVSYNIKIFVSAGRNFLKVFFLVLLTCVFVVTIVLSTIHI